MLTELEILETTEAPTWMTAENDMPDELENARRVSLDITRMKRRGVLVDVDVHGMSMFSRRVTWAELGIPDEDTRRKRLHRGSKDLLPKKYMGKLRSLETRFRQSLDRHSFLLQGFQPYRWVPFTAYAAWKEQWAELQEELEDLKSQILTFYETFVEDLRGDFAEIAQEAWDAIRARRPDDAGEFAVITRHGVYESREAFIEAVVDHAIAQMPSREDIRNGLYVDYKNALVVTGADLEEELLRYDELATARAREHDAQDRLRDEKWQRKVAMNLKQREMEQAADLRMQAERAKLEAMRQAELEHARKQVAQTVSPLQEVFEQFRAQISSDVNAIARSIDKNGHVRGKVAQRARGLLDAYRLLGSATGDEELEEALRDLRSRLAERPEDPDEGKYDTGSVMVSLRQIAELCHEQAELVELRASGRTRAGALEI